GAEAVPRAVWLVGGTEPATKAARRWGLPRSCLAAPQCVKRSPRAAPGCRIGSGLKQESRQPERGAHAYPTLHRAPGPGARDDPRAPPRSATGDRTVVLAVASCV